MPLNDNLDLPHLVRVCEAATPGPWRYANYTIYDHRGDRIATIPEGCHYIANFIAIFNPSTSLTLLRRLMEAQEKVKQLEDVIYPPSIAPTGGMFAGLPDLKVVGVRPNRF